MNGRGWRGVRGGHRVALAAAVVVAGAATPVPASADSFTPVVLQVSAASVARLHQPLVVTVAVSADPGVLDVRSAPLRVRVKLAAECGGDFAGTPGVVLLDRRLDPQPAPGEAYTATTHGSGKPVAYGVQSVCVFVEAEADNRQFATDTSSQVDVSRPCTSAAARLDATRAALTRAQAKLRHARTAAARASLNKALRRLRSAAGSQRRSAGAACGPGVRL